MSEESYSLKQEGGFQGLKVLVVDDVDINRLVVETMLTKAGATVTSVASGMDAITAVKSTGYDAVLMDILMPGMSGYEATRIIRQTARDLPIIALSSSEDQAEALACGMNHFLSKPVEWDALFQALKQHCGQGVTSHTSAAVTSQDSSTNGMLSTPPCMQQKSLQSLYGNNAALILRCVKSFCHSFEDWGAHYHQACVCEDAKTARELAHKLKGAAANIGDVSLAELAGQLENHHRAEQWQGSNQILTLFSNHLNQLQAWVQSCEQPLPTKGNGSIDLTQALQMLEELNELLAKHRLIEDDTITALRELAEIQTVKNDTERLILSLELFDYATALQHCNNIIRELKYDV